jgi:hypothetical protein
MNLGVDNMNYRKVFLFVGIICIAVSSIALADILPNPNLNNDNTANFYDFVIFANNWQQTGTKLQGDFDDSNTIDIDDLMMFCSYWLTEYSEYQQCQGIDLDSDGIIAFEDMAKLALNWLSIGAGLSGDFDDSNLVDYNDLSVMADCWLKGSRPESVFEQFKVALAAGDVNTAVSYFTEISAENHRIFFEQVRPYLQQMVSEMGEIIFIEQHEGITYYDVLREESGQFYAYPVIFVRDEKGQWKIYDF